MVVKVTPLSDKKIKSAKVKDKDYVLSDGEGLQLTIRTSGSKLQNVNYKHPQTRKCINIGFGIYPSVSLVNARIKATKARVLLAQDIGPKEEINNKLIEKKAISEHTVKNIALEWYELKKIQ